MSGVVSEWWEIIDEQAASLQDQAALLIRVRNTIGIAMGEIQAGELKAARQRLGRAYDAIKAGDTREAGDE